MTRLQSSPPLRPPSSSVRGAVRSRVRSWFIAYACGCLAVMLGAHVLSESLGLRFCQPFHNEILYHKVRFFEKEIRSPAVVYLGNSQIHYGVMPSVVAAEAARLGKPIGTAYNLALPGTGLEINRLMLRDLLQGERQPSLVVLGVSPFMLAVENTEPETEYWRYGGIEDVVEFWQSEKRVPASAMMVSGFRGVSNLFQYALAGSRKPSLIARPEHLRQGGGCYWLPEQVATTQPTPPERWDASARRLQATAARFTFSDDSRPASLLRQIRDLAKERGIQLVLVYPPQPPCLCENLYLPGSVEGYEEWIAAFCRKEKLTYINCNDAAFDQATHFYDPYHLNARGAELYSRKLAAIITHPRSE